MVLSTALLCWYLYQPQHPLKKAKGVLEEQLAHLNRPLAFSGRVDQPFAIGCQVPDTSAQRANATIVMLARNEDLNGVLSSLSSFERHFNRWFHYPYVFLNDQAFTDQFKSSVEAHISSVAEFAEVSASDWEFPNDVPAEWIQQSLNAQGDASLPYGGLKSYHQMCRYFSGKFYHHPLLQKFKWYWRVEPKVQFFCDITYDVFLEMERHNKVYGYNVLAKEFVSVIPNLYRYTSAFRQSKSIPATDLWEAFSECQNFTSSTGKRDKRTKMATSELQDQYMNGCRYNLCHFWSNFEISRFDLWKQPLYEEYFSYLESKDGFWRERWGDAPVHTFGAALLLNASQVHYFRDIGYSHTDIGHCPTNAPGRQIPLSEVPYNANDEYWSQSDPEVANGVGCRCRCPTKLAETEDSPCFRDTFGKIYDIGVSDYNDYNY